MENTISSFQGTTS